MERDEGAFDIIVIGTGLTESITAAALSKAGFKVAQLDESPYYGSDEASLAQEEFLQWQDRPVGPDDIYSSHSRSTNDILPQSRQYSISLLPSIIPSTGPLITSLIQSGVSRYGGFRMIEQVATYHASGVKPVPSSKEDIFKDKSISLVEKRRLMRFIKFASEEFETAKELEGKQDQGFFDFLRSTFSLNDDMSTAIVYALSYCQSPSDPTLPALQRLRRYLRSAGRYGKSPFLVGHYGSAGEIAQGFCRTSAVAGGVYILGRKITSVKRTTEQQQSPESNQPTYTIQMDEFPEPLTCKVLISSTTRIPEELLPAERLSELRKRADSVTTARCVAIIDKPLSFGRDEAETDTAASEDVPEADEGSEIENAPLSSSKPMDVGILIYPPSSLPEGEASSTVDVLVEGEGTMSTPQGKWIVYLSTLNTEGRSPEALLKPYLEATLKLQKGVTSTPITPLFISYYNQRSASPTHASTDSTAPLSDSPSPLALSDLPNYILVPQLPVQPLPEPPDVANVNAERVFSEAVRILKPEESVSFWPPLPAEEEDDE